jgi:hypothetical protein
LIRHDHPWGVSAPLEQLPKEFLGSCFVAPTLHEDAEDMALLTHGTPQVMAFTADAEKELIQMPLIVRPGASPAELIRVCLAQFATPFADRFIGHHHAADEQKLFHIAITAAEAEAQSDAVANNFGWEAVVFIAVSDRCIHAKSVTH